jgi:putative PIG3 family NAD(P)H quinone oxidoreductase
MGKRMMKVVQMNAFGGRDVLGFAEMSRPRPRPDQVLVKVAATSVNRADIIQREGHYPPPPGESNILGLEIAGTVHEVGAEVDQWRPGDRVMGLVGGGGYAEYALAYAQHLIPIPPSVNFFEAACICEVYQTAFLNVFLLGGLSNGESVLLHGGGGGVNTAAIQLCRHLRSECRLFVTASTGKIKRVQQLGVEHVVDYRKQEFAEEVRRLTQGQGVNLILDHIGAAYLKHNMRCLAVEGRLIIIGVMGGAEAKLNLAHLLVKRQRVIGSVIRSRPIAEKAKIAQAFAKQILPLIADGTIKPLIHAVLPLAEVRKAHQMMEESRHFGKIVLSVLSE